jgi:CHAT domain-containing protein
VKTLRLCAALSFSVALHACKLENTSDRPTSVSRGPGEAISLTVPTQPAALAAALGVPPDSLRAAGEERYNNQEYDSARAILQVEVTRARQADDGAAEARARMWIGLAAWHLGDFKSARKQGEIAVSMKRRLGLDAELSKSFNALGLLAWHEGRYADALTQFDSAVTSARRNKDIPGIARAASNIPLVQVELGSFDSARVGFNRAIAAGRETRDDRLQGNALANLAMLEIRLGNGSRALPLLVDARQHYRKIGYGTGEANALGQLSTAWSQLGDLQRAIATADSGLTIGKAEGLQQEVAATLEVLADLEAQAGDLRRSLQLLRSADSLDASMGLSLEQGTNQRRMAAILTELGESAAAITRARAALAIHHKVSARNEESYDRMQLAYSLALSGDSAAARSEADSSMKLAIAVNNPAAIRDAAAVSAHLALISGNPKAALAYLDRAGNARASDDWRLLDLRAASLFRLGRFSNARSEEANALHALERERASLGFGPLRAGYLANRSAPFSHMIEIDLVLHDTAAAFEVAASLPGRSLGERLGGVTNPPKSIAVVAAREERLLRIAALERELDDSRTDSDPPAKQISLERLLESARSEYEDQLNRNANVTQQGGFDSTSTRLSVVRQKLEHDEALLLFLSGPERLDMFVVTPRGAYHRGAPISQEILTQRVRFARESIGRSHDSGGVPRALSDLFDLLIKPANEAGALRGVSNLILVPQGSLGALPFAALWNKASGRFLVEDYVISYLPSLVALSRSSQTRPPATAVSVFAPLPDSLPGTKNEARAIAEIMPSTITLIGPAATEERFRAAMLQGRTIHVASHGSHNSQNPLFSRMIVGRARSAARSDDGRLEVHEILELTTHAPLVFLSGCETGIGGEGDGGFALGSDEGSLAQAFLIAGASTVVATLWRIDDMSAARLASSFYKQLKAGAAPDKALALAQREALIDRRNYTWAAYDVFGARSRNSAGRIRTTVP